MVYRFYNFYKIIFCVEPTSANTPCFVLVPVGVIALAPVTVTPVDTTGAGDAFIGSFAHFFAAGHDAPAALAQAARYAALSITRRGTQKSYATPDEFAAFCEQNP